MSLSIKQAYQARFVAVKVGWLRHERPSLVRLYTHKPKELYWGAGGFTHCGFDPVAMTVVKDYGIHSDHDEEAIDALEVQYYKDFPPEPSLTLRLSEGWLSPDGVFYPCEYGEHTSLAHHLAMAFYESYDGERLIEKTYIRIYERMAMIILDATPTLAQMETLRSMVDVNSDLSYFVKAFRRFCELHDMPDGQENRVIWWAD